MRRQIHAGPIGKVKNIKLYLFFIYLFIHYVTDNFYGFSKR